MGRLIDAANIRVKPQYMQDVMGIAMIRCEDLSRILADAPTEEAIPKADYEAKLKADMVTMLTEIQLEIEELKSYESADGQDLAMIADIGILFQQKIDAMKMN